MRLRPLGRCGLSVSPIAFGAFKIGRNEKTKYPGRYELPEERFARELLDAALDLGINLIDTAPAYGLSEERIGNALQSRRGEFVLSTKAGETFERGESRYDFSAAAIGASLARSISRLRTDAIDLLLLHAPADDVGVLTRTDAVAALQSAKARGDVRAIGLSAKTVEAACMALGWADVLMVEYHLQDRSFEPVIEVAREAGVGVIVKKGLASGRLSAADAIRFVLSNPGVTTLTVGSLNVEHLRENCRTAEEAIGPAS